MAKRLNLATLKILIFASIAVIAIFVLATSLSNLELLPGNLTLLEQLLRQLLAKLFLDEMEYTTPTGGGQVLLFFLRVVYTFVLVGLPFAIVYFIISAEFRKRFIKLTSSLAIVWVGLYLWIRVLEFLKAKKESGTPQVLVDSSPKAEGGWESLTEFTPAPSQPLILFSSFVLAVLLALLLTYVVWLTWYRRHPPETCPLDNLAEAVQNALDAFQVGGDFTNIIVRCYAEMSQALEEQRGIRRKEAMTAREFENLLYETDLPHEPVRQLTRMFEDVRYGAKTPDEDEERQTIASLAAIVEACKNVS